jgi:hypothetical protein
MKINTRQLTAACGFAAAAVVCITVTANDESCITIHDGMLMYSATSYLWDQPLQRGYDDYGYNYQAHMFNGSYFNAYANSAGFPPYEGDDDTYLAENPGAANHWAWPWREVTLQMKWNDAWLSNKDCDGNLVLDRYYGFSSYVGSGAWLTNHMSGSDEIEVNGKMKNVHWTYFVKIVAAPDTATSSGGVWYDEDGIEIGNVIWGSFATVQQVENDPALLVHGQQYLSPSAVGFGQYAPK